MQSDEAFLLQVNANLGIAHKVCRLYFDDPDDREDALQEMMYQLWRSYANFGGRAKFSTWMYSVCLRTALTHRRKNKKHISESISETHEEIADYPSKDKDETIELLFEAIGALQPVNKAVVLLYLENMTYDEISEITGLSRSNVSVRLVRIKKELEIQLKKKIKSIEDVDL